MFSGFKLILERTAKKLQQLQDLERKNLKVFDLKKREYIPVKSSSSTPLSQKAPSTPESNKNSHDLQSLKSRLDSAVKSNFVTSIKKENLPTSFNIQEETGGCASAQIKCPICKKIFKLVKEPSSAWKTANYYKHVRKCIAKPSGGDIKNFLPSPISVKVVVHAANEQDVLSLDQDDITEPPTETQNLSANFTDQSSIQSDEEEVEDVTSCVSKESDKLSPSNSASQSSSQKIFKEDNALTELIKDVDQNTSSTQSLTPLEDFVQDTNDEDDITQKPKQTDKLSPSNSENQSSTQGEKFSTQDMTKEYEAVTQLPKNVNMITSSTSSSCCTQSLNPLAQSTIEEDVTQQPKNRTESQTLSNSSNQSSISSGQPVAQSIATENDGETEHSTKNATKSNNDSKLITQSTSRSRKVPSKRYSKEDEDKIEYADKIDENMASNSSVRQLRSHKQPAKRVLYPVFHNLKSSKSKIIVSGGVNTTNDKGPIPVLSDSDDDNIPLLHYNQTEREIVASDDDVHPTKKKRVKQNQVDDFSDSDGEIPF